MKNQSLFILFFLLFFLSNTFSQVVPDCGTPLNDIAFSMIENANSQEKPYSFIVMGDSQMSECHEELFGDLTDRILNDPNFDVSFIINVGDFLPKDNGDGNGCPSDYEAYYNSISTWMEETGLPYLSIPGNHEMDAQDDCMTPDTPGALERYLDCIGDTDWNFNFGGCEFIGINNVQHTGVYAHPGDAEGEHFEITEEQLNQAEEWLQDSPDCIFSFSHTGLANGNYTCKDEHGYDGYMDYYNLLLNYGVTANFHGHVHESGRERNALGLYDVRVGGGGDNIVGFEEYRTKTIVEHLESLGIFREDFDENDPVEEAEYQMHYKNAKEELELCSMPCDYVGYTTPPNHYPGLSYTVVTVNENCETEIELYVRNGDENDPFTYNVADGNLSNFNANLSECAESDDCDDIVEDPIFNDDVKPEISFLEENGICHVCIDIPAGSHNAEVINDLSANLEQSNSIRIIVDGEIPTIPADLGNGLTCYEIDCGEPCTDEPNIEVEYHSCETFDRTGPILPPTSISESFCICPVEDADVIITEECITLGDFQRCRSFCDFDNDGDLDPSFDDKWIRGRTKVNVKILNTDCTSEYSIHILRPDGSWVPHKVGTEYSFFVTVPGNYEIRVRQDNDRLDITADPNQNGKRTRYFYRDYNNRFCCIPVSDEDCFERPPEFPRECFYEDEEVRKYEFELSYSADDSRKIRTINSLNQYAIFSDLALGSDDVMRGKVAIEKDNPFLDLEIGYEDIAISDDLHIMPYQEIVDQCEYSDGEVGIDNNDVIGNKFGSDFTEIKEELNVYPNPTSGELNFEISINEERFKKNIFHLKIVDFLGKEVKSFSIQNAKSRINYNSSDIPEGIYLINLFENDMLLKSRKITLIK